MALHKFFTGVAVTCLVLIGIIVFTPSILFAALRIYTSFFELDHAANLQLIWGMKFLLFSVVQHFGAVLTFIGGLFLTLITSSVLAYLTHKKAEAIPTPPKP